ncbi:zf-HC2 domain-containing protein [Micromonospora zamorensis]|uniref:zf-HC2 domain-containing protein n=1 Tax=Micromonospora zamorensis TaxID=709883 RepID=UPI002E220B7D
MRAEDVSGTDAHVADLLALYHLDALDRRSGEQVGRHLQSCPQCRAAATEVCETLAALALLSDDRDHLLNRYGALGTAVPAAFPARFAPQEPAGQPGREAQETDRRRFRLRRGGTGAETATGEASAAAGPDLGRREPPQQRVAPAPVTPPPVAPPPAAPPPVAPPRAAPPPAAPPPVALVEKPSPVQEQTTPTAVPLPTRTARRPVTHPAQRGFGRAPGIAHPDDGQRVRRKRLLSRRAVTFAGLGALLMAALTVAGISARALLAPPAPGVQTNIVRTAVASATDRDSGANLSVFLTEERDGVTVRATLSGLAEGTGYRLYGYTFDGRQRPLVNWTGRAGVQELDGELPVGIADLSHFAVTRGTRIVVTAYLPRDAGAPATPGE